MKNSKNNNIFLGFCFLYLVSVYPMNRTMNNVEKILEDTEPGFNPIIFTLIANSNYWRESLLEVIRQNIAG